MSDTDKNEPQLLTIKQIQEFERVNILKRIVHDVHERILASGKTPNVAQLKAQNSMFQQGIETIELLTASALVMREMIDRLVDECVDPEKLERAGEIVCLASNPDHFNRPINGCPSCGWPKPQDMGESEISEAEKDRIEALIRRIADETP